MVQLDGTNIRLLEMLQDDARTSIIDLARSVDRAESTVRERIAALERDGVLRGYRALVDPEKLGYGARAIVRADCDRRRIAEVGKRLAAVANVTSVTLTTGPKPLAIEVVAESLARLEQVLEERIAPLDLDNIEVDVVLRALVPPRPIALHAAMPAVMPPAVQPEPALLEPLGALARPAEVKARIPLPAPVR
jgi:DNA-binding Lrp family transcriptional regulator